MSSAAERESRRAYVSNAAADARRKASAEADAPLQCIVSEIEASLGFSVIIAPLGRDIAGLYAPLNGGVAVIAGKDTPVRRRFTLAHELGHHCLGHGDRLDTPETIRDAPTEDEVDANQFAAEFIAPREAVESYVESLDDASPTLELVCRVSNFFAVSAQMARIRLETCGILTDRQVNGRLDSEIIAGKTKSTYEALELSDRDDLCATPTEELPRIPKSAKDTMLGDLVTGEMSPAEYSRLTGMDEQTVERLFVPRAASHSS
jgi:Zn-dependent peptidase ImmA (M78 family)